MTEIKILKTDNPHLDAKIGYEIIGATERAIHVKMLLEIRTALESGAGTCVITHAGTCWIPKSCADDATWIAAAKKRIT